MYQKTQLAVGVASLLIGIVTLAYNAGAFNYITLSTLAVTPEGQKIGVDVSTSVVSYPYPLSAVEPGRTYIWEVKAKNTGDIDWKNSWVTVRVGIKGSEVTTHYEENVIGKVTIEECEYGPDKPECRVDLRDWGIEYKNCPCKESCTWTTPDIDDKVASVVFGAIEAGDSKTACFKLEIPEDTEHGSYPLITNLIADVGGGKYAVDSEVDTLTIGEIDGKLVLNMVGVLTLSLGAIFTALAFKKP